MPTDFGFDVLFDEGPCLVVNKPGGVLTQAPPGIDSLETRVKRFLAHRRGDDQPVYLGVPHRLDRHVSGAMVFATRRKAARRLSEQFEGRLVRKIYWAVVQGQVAPSAGTWTDMLRKMPNEAKVEIVAPDDPAGRQAVLTYEVRSSWAGLSWLEVRPETGRMHQIRVQAASRGHVILGDQFYGSGRPFGPQTEDHRLRSIALHARELGFAHPQTREPIEIVAPLPHCWDELSLPALS